MKRHLALRRLLLVLPLLTTGGPALAQGANRVFVAAKTGNDGPQDCSDVANPCKTFGWAIAKVAVGGEIIALESGGYGLLTVDRPVRINAPAGIVAFIHPSSGEAIRVNAGVSATVVLRGLTLNGGTTHGVNVQSVGTLFVENCTITGFAGDGIHFAGGGKLVLRNVDVRDSGNSGVEVGSGTAVIRDSTFSNNVNGVSASGGASVAVSRSAAADNTIGFYAAGSSMLLDGVQAVSNSFAGLSVGASGTLRFVNSVVSQNVRGAVSAGGGTLLGTSPGTSVLDGNPSGDGIAILGTPMTLR